MTAPVKVLAALSRVMLLAAPAVRLVVVPIDSTPLWVSAPPVVTASAPVMLMAPSTKALRSRRVRFSPLVTPTAPVKSLPALSSSTLLPAPGVRLVVVPTDSAPLWVMLVMPAPAASPR